MRRLLGAVAADLARTPDLLRQDLLPEVVRLILEHTGENLPLLWPDAVGRPEANLLFVAVRTTLEVLAGPPGDDVAWRVRFRRADLFRVLEVVVNEVTSNPGWVVDAAGRVDRTLKDVLESVLAVLRTRADARLSVSTASANWPPVR